MERHSDRLYLSAITVVEIEDGIAKARREGARKKAALLASWLEAVLHLYGARILPVDVAVARALGGLADVAHGQGLAPGFADLAIAATAQVFGLAVLTRNLRHFQMLPVACCDPFVALPG
jgi:predicted nucleic acid-binding protein